MYDDLTSKQIEILKFIKRYIDYKGYPPAIREIGDSLNINSTSTVFEIRDEGLFKKRSSKK